MPKRSILPARESVFNEGFTLIELSLVLVIVGLIVGGILVGQDLIRAAAIRAQISQIEKYNTAASTFYGKYGYLPGDITNAAAVQFGFLPRATDPYGYGTLQGNGDGIIYGDGGYGWACCGETLMFWVDLSTAGLVDSNFNAATPGGVYFATGPSVGLYLPWAKIGQGNSVSVWSDYCATGCGSNFTYTGNYYAISTITQLNGPGTAVDSVPALTVQQAYTMDKKVDDGLPLSGRVITEYPAATLQWVGTANSSTAVSGSATTCYDNGGNIASPVVYSIAQNGGSGVNCALSFRFQ